MWVWSLGGEDSLEEGMHTHFSILAWRIPWTEELGGLQSMGSQRVGHDWSDLACMGAIGSGWKGPGKNVYPTGQAGTQSGPRLLESPCPWSKGRITEMTHPWGPGAFLVPEAEPEQQSHSSHASPTPGHHAWSGSSRVLLEGRLRRGAGRPSAWEWAWRRNFSWGQSRHWERP